MIKKCTFVCFILEQHGTGTQWTESRSDKISDRIRIGVLQPSSFATPSKRRKYRFGYAATFLNNRNTLSHITLKKYHAAPI